MVRRGKGDSCGSSSHVCLSVCLAYLFVYLFIYKITYLLTYLLTYPSNGNRIGIHMDPEGLVGWLPADLLIEYT